MKTKVLFVAAIATVGMSSVFTSCKKEEPQVDKCPLEKETKAVGVYDLKVNAFIDSETRAFTEKSSWVNGDKLGLFILNQGSGAETAFPGTNLNTPFTYGARGWEGVNVGVSSEMPRVCAYSPYDASKGDVKAVAFDRSVDFLYVTPTSPVVSAGNANVNLNMKHALCQFRIQMTKSASYKGAGKITSLKIVKESGNLYTTGKVNLINGEISGGTTVNELSYSPNTDITTNTMYGDAAIPTSGTFKLAVVIDGRPFSCSMGQTIWAAGKKYTYSFSLNATSLTLGDPNGDGSSNGITVENWGDGGSKSLNMTAN